jgi:transcriptional regulator with XRE-family HTH domain
MEIGPRVRERRRAQKLSQEQLAQRVGVTWSAIQRLEAGQVQDPHYSTLLGIASALGTTVADLIGELAPVGKDSPPVVGAHGAMREMDVSKQRRAVEQASETVVEIRYSDEEIDPSEAFAEAARIWPEVRQDYEGVLSSEPPHKLTLSDDGECVQIVVEPASESDCT